MTIKRTLIFATLLTKKCLLEVLPILSTSGKEMFLPMKKSFLNSITVRLSTSLSANVMPNCTFVNKAGTFGDHPTWQTKQHLNSSSHLECVKNKQAFDEIAKRRTNLWMLLQEAQSFTISEKNSPINRFIIKSFSRITHLMIKKNWAHTHNFKDIVELIAHCGDKEVQRHLLIALKNRNYTPPQHRVKYIDIMNH